MSKKEYILEITEKNITHLASSLSLLWGPLVEVVVHNLKNKKICFIQGAQSTRKVGDPSFLDSKDTPYSLGVIGPYRKKGEQGLDQRSISVVMGDQTGEPHYLFCVNFQLSEFQRMHRFFQFLLEDSATPPLKEHFQENWQDKINSFIADYLKAKGNSEAPLHKKQKKELILALRDKGAFKGKHAAQYIAQSLGVSRASVYSYLKENA